MAHASGFRSCSIAFLSVVFSSAALAQSDPPKNSSKPKTGGSPPIIISPSGPIPTLPGTGHSPDAVAPKTLALGNGLLKALINTTQ